MTTHDEFITQLAGRLRRDSQAGLIAAMFLRTRNADGRDLMARGATDGALDSAGLVAHARDTITSDLALDLPWLVGLARLFALQDGGPEDQQDGLALLDFAARTHGPAALDSDSANLYGQLLLRAGQTDQLAAVMPELRLSPQVRWSLDLDLTNPFTTDSSAESWLQQLNEALLPRGLEPVRLDGQAEVPFDQLTSQPTSYFDDELVTVVMSAYRPGPSIFMSVRSILAQSWRNLELLVVDDASGPEYRTILDQVAAMDERVKVLTMPTNGGTYLVRNFAMEHARGEYVTFQDFDDWSHPRRLEHQVWALRARKDVLATRCWTARAYPDLTFTFPGYPPDRISAVSFLFRRQPVVDLIGYFDSVRKSADIEYAARLKAAAPGSLLDLRTGPPLMICQLRQDSLSRSDAVPGWLRWNRIAYRDAYTHWHRKIRKGEAEPRLDRRHEPGPHPQLTPRPMPLPEASWAGQPREDDPRMVYDVVYLHDWRKGRGPLSAQVTEIRHLFDGGLRVALAHAETPTPLAPYRQHLAPAVQDLVNTGAVDFVHLEQPVEASLLLVGDPRVLQFPPGVTPGVKAERVVVIVDDSAEGSAVSRSYFLPDCARHAVDLFGRRPQWLPRHAWARQLLTGQLDELLPFDLPVPVVTASLRTSRLRPGRGRPVIGRWSTGEHDDWPATRADLLAAYPDDDRFDVRIAGPADPALAILKQRHLPPNWVQFSHGRATPREFLAQLDFLVHFPGTDTATPVPQVALEAMAAGCIVVAPQAFSEAFGAAVVGCTPREVPAVVMSLHGSPTAYREQQERGFAHVENTIGAKGYVGLVRRLIDR